MPKKDLLFVISYFFGSANNFVAYLSAIPKEAKRVWELVMNNYFASDTHLKQETGKDCIQCLSCLQYCPKQAISMGGATETRERYHNPNVSAADLCQKVIHID